MADQLSLHLESGTPRLPGTLRPMLAQTALEPFDSPDHLFEPSWGGTRVLAFIEAVGDGARPPVRLLDEHGRDVAALLPELRGLAHRIAAESAILDGEIVVVDRLGRADRLALAARLRGKPGPSVALLAFDVLYRDGRPLFNQPLERRREILRKLLQPGDEAVAVPSIAGEGRALYAAVVEAGIAGVMGRLRRSPYLPGVRSRMWQFVARRDDMGDAASRSTDAGGADANEADQTTPDAPDGSDASYQPGAPVIALIRRLPLDDMDR